jgi:hypothetical protein
MSDDPNIALLLQAGDPLEKLVCANSEPLLPVLSPYAYIWVHYVLPRRVGDGAFVQEPWLPFAGSHYTALIRLHHALEEKQRIVALCRDAEKVAGRQPTGSDYKLLLDVHARCASFWENLGSTVDNFFHAWGDAKKALNQRVKPVKGEENEPVSGKTVSEKEYPKLAYAYYRRTQFIHSRLIPKRLEDGMIVFNSHHYDDETTKWKQELETDENIDAQICRNWDEVLTELSTAWYKFAAWLAANDVAPTKIEVTKNPDALDDSRSEHYRAPLSGVQTSVPPSGSRY